MEPVAYTFFVLVITIALFIWGKIRADLVAILSFMALYIGGILSTDQALSGFSNSTVIMIAALFVVGEGLSRTGVTTWLSRKIIAFAGNSPTRILVVLMFGTAVLSGFISNTGTVATLMPAAIAIAWSINTLPSKLLMPLAFAANAGGLLTLTGTPPNIVVSEALSKAGYQPFGYFEYGYIGLPLLIIAVIYIVFIGQKLLPDKHSSGKPMDLAESMRGMADSFSLQGKLFLVYTGSSSSIIGKSLEEVAFGRDFQVSVLRIEHSDLVDQRDSRKQRRRQVLRKLRQSSIVPPIPSRDCLIEPLDVMLIKGSPSNVERAAEALNLEVEEIDTTEEKLTQFLVTPEVGIAEVLVNPRSEYIGQSLQEGDFRQRYNVQVISILRREEVVDKSEARLEFGDALMIRASWDKIGLIKKDVVNFTVIGCPDELSKQVTTLNCRSYGGNNGC